MRAKSAISKQTYWFSVAWEIQKAAQSEWLGQLESVVQGLNEHTFTNTHTLSQWWEADDTLFLTFLIYNKICKMFHFQWETRKQLFPSHMAQAAKQYYKCRRFLNSSVYSEFLLVLQMVSSFNVGKCSLHLLMMNCLICSHIFKVILHLKTLSLSISVI